MTPGVPDIDPEMTSAEPLMVAARHRTDAPHLAHRYVRRALELGSGQPDLEIYAAEILSAGVPSWHFEIVADTCRNDAYSAAIRHRVFPGARVLDVGTGTGLLAMLAVQAGAEHVYACEASEAVAAAAAEVVRRNGYADRITVLPKPSFAVDPTTDLGGRVDLLVSEVLSNELIGEGVLDVHADTVTRCLKDNGRVIPLGGTINVALGRYADLDRHRMAHVCGFDLSSFNALAAPAFGVSNDSPRLELVSEPTRVFDFDFATGGPFPHAARTVDLVPFADGANGIAQWFSLQLTDDIVIENRPRLDVWSSWQIMFHPLGSPGIMPTAAGAVRVHAAHTMRALRIWVGQPHSNRDHTATAESAS